MANGDKRSYLLAMPPLADHGIDVLFWHNTDMTACCTPLPRDCGCRDRCGTDVELKAIPGRQGRAAGMQQGKMQHWLPCNQ